MRSTFERGTAELAEDLLRGRETSASPPSDPLHRGITWPYCDGDNWRYAAQSMSVERPEQGYVINNRVGKLIEARVFGLKTREDADAYSRDLGIQVMRMPRSVRPILCADHRPVAIYPQPAADRLVELFLQMNARLERVAILVSPTNATLTMQLNRFVREASYAARRVFQRPDEANVHLAPVLDVEELARMRDFLDEFKPGL